MDGVQRPVEPAVATTVEPMADHASEGSLDGYGTGEHGERGLRAPPRMGPADEYPGGGERLYAGRNMVRVLIAATRPTRS